MPRNRHSELKMIEANVLRIVNSEGQTRILLHADPWGKDATIELYGEGIGRFTLSFDSQGKARIWLARNERLNIELNHYLDCLETRLDALTQECLDLRESLNTPHQNSPRFTPVLLTSAVGPVARVRS